MQLEFLANDPQRRPQAARLLTTGELVYPAPNQRKIYIDADKLHKAAQDMGSKMVESALASAQEKIRFENISTYMRDGRTVARNPITRREHRLGISFPRGTQVHALAEKKQGKRWEIIRFYSDSWQTPADRDTAILQAQKNLRSEKAPVPEKAQAAHELYQLGALDKAKWVTSDFLADLLLDYYAEIFGNIGAELFFSLSHRAEKLYRDQPAQYWKAAYIPLLEAENLPEKQALLRLRQAVVALPTVAAGMEETLESFIRREIKASSLPGNLKPILSLQAKQLQWATPSQIQAMIRSSVGKKQAPETAARVLAVVQRAKEAWKSRPNLAHLVVGKHSFPVFIFSSDNTEPSYQADAQGQPTAGVLFNFPGYGFPADQKEALHSAVALIGRALDSANNPEQAALEALTFLLDSSLDQAKRFLQQYAIPPADQQKILEMKELLLQTGMAGPVRVLRAIMGFLEIPDESSGEAYGVLFDSINHVLTNSGNNPRLQASGPIQSIEDLDPKKGLHIRAMKEGRMTAVFQVTAHLKDGRQARFAVQAAKDSGAASENLREAYTLLSRDYDFDPAYAVEPFEAGVAGGLAVMISEWVEGFDELHVYPETGTDIHVWQAGKPLRNPQPLAGPVSKAIWRRMIWLQAYYTHYDEKRLAHVPELELNSGDPIGKPEDPENPSSPWKLLLIWDRGESGVSPTHLVYSALFASATGDTLDGRRERVWLDDPELAVRAVAEGTRDHFSRILQKEGLDAPEAGLIAEQLARGLLDVSLNAIPSLLAPSSGFLPDHLTAAEKARSAEILRKGGEEIERYLREGISESAGAEELSTEQLQTLFKTIEEGLSRFPPERYGYGDDLRRPEIRLLPGMRQIIGRGGRTPYGPGIWLDPAILGEHCAVYSTWLADQLTTRGIPAKVVEGSNALWMHDYLVELVRSGALISITPGVKTIQGLPDIETPGASTSVPATRPRFTAEEMRSDMELQEKEGLRIDGGLLPMGWHALTPTSGILTKAGWELNPPFSSHFMWMSVQLVTQYISEGAEAGKITRTISIPAEEFPMLHRALQGSEPENVLGTIQRVSDAEVDVRIEGWPTELQARFNQDVDLLHHLIVKLDPNWVRQHAAGAEESWFERLSKAAKAGEESGWFRSAEGFLSPFRNAAKALDRFLVLPDLLPVQQAGFQKRVDTLDAFGYLMDAFLRPSSGKIVLLKYVQNSPSRLKVRLEIPGPAGRASVLLWIVRRKGSQLAVFQFLGSDESPAAQVRIGSDSKRKGKPLIHLDLSEPSVPDPSVSFAWKHHKNLGGAWKDPQNPAQEQTLAAFENAFIAKLTEKVLSLPRPTHVLTIPLDEPTFFYRPETLAPFFKDWVAEQKEKDPIAARFKFMKMPIPASPKGIRRPALILKDRWIPLPFESSVPTVEHTLGAEFPHSLLELVAMARLGKTDATQVKLVSAWTFEKDGRSYAVLAVQA